MSIIKGGHFALGNIKVTGKLYTFKNGVYIAKIATIDPDTNKLIYKTNNLGISYMFPEFWSADRIKFEINSAYKNRKVHSIPTREKEGLWEGISLSGVHIEGYSFPVITAYPSEKQE